MPALRIYGSRVLVLLCGASLFSACGTGDEATNKTFTTRDGLLTPIPVGNGPTGVAVEGDDVWVALQTDDTVVRLSRSGKRVEGAPISVGDAPTALTTGFDSVWVANRGSSTVTRIARDDTTKAESIAVGAEPDAILSAFGAVWVVSSGDGTVAKIDPVTNKVAHTTRVGKGLADIGAGPRRVWVLNSPTGSVRGLDPGSGRVTKTIGVTPGSTHLATSGGVGWTTPAGIEEIERIPLLHPGPAVRKPVGVRPSGLGLTEGSLWLLDSTHDEVLRVDPLTGEPQAEAFYVGADPWSVAGTSADAWFTAFTQNTVVKWQPK